MLYSTILAIAAAGSAVAAPFSLPNGFPNIKASSLAHTEKTAGGTLPNTPLPTNLKKDAIQTLQLIAVNASFYGRLAQGRRTYADLNLIRPHSHP